MNITSINTIRDTITQHKMRIYTVNDDGSRNLRSLAVDLHKRLHLTRICSVITNQEH
ncbi:hypothetical protein Hanom_Chr11g00995401 [Helianthus anomalus]